MTEMSGEQMDPGEVLLRSDRYFQLWSYHAGTRSLLLRSTVSDKRSTRLDVLFTGSASWF